MERDIARKRERESAGQERADDPTTTDQDRDTLRQTSIGLVNLQYARSGAAPDMADQDEQEVAQEGVRGEGEALPHLDAIQAAFGSEHDLSTVRAHTGAEAQEAAGALGAEAYATGRDVAFAGTPDLHTAAHEAAHVVQQRAGVMRKGGTGRAGDHHEREADAVADRVVAGESAASLLASYASPGGNIGATAVQLKGGKNRGKKGPKPTPPTVASNSDVHEAVIEDAVRARDGFVAAKDLADAVYPVILAMANSKAVHEQAVEDYKAAQKARADTLKKSDLEKVWEAIDNLVTFGTGVYGVFKAVQTVYKSAKGMHSAYKAYKETKGEWIYGVGDQSGGHLKEVGQKGKEGGKAAWEGVKGGKDTYDKGKEMRGGGSSFDPDTILPETNHAAIKAGNDALERLSETQLGVSLVSIANEARNGARELAFSGRSLDDFSHKNMVLSDESLGKVESSMKAAEDAHRVYQDAIKKVHQAWNAYKAGGSAALQDDRERSLFETVATWVRNGDKKKDGLHVAMDQKYKKVLFDGTGTKHEETDLWNRTTRYHKYKEDEIQQDEGTLFISDPEVAKELADAGLIRESRDGLWAQEGLAETALQAQLKIDRKYELSISMCKALISLGLHNWFVDCTVTFHDGGTRGGHIKGRHGGDWYENWKDHPEFTKFWQSKLGGTLGYIKGDKDIETFAGADDKARNRATSYVTYR